VLTFMKLYALHVREGNNYKSFGDVDSKLG